MFFFRISFEFAYLFCFPFWNRDLALPTFTCLMEIEAMLIRASCNRNRTSKLLPASQWDLLFASTIDRSFVCNFRPLRTSSKHLGLEPYTNGRINTPYWGNTQYALVECSKCSSSLFWFQLWVQFWVHFWVFKVWISPFKIPRFSLWAFSPNPQKK